MAFRTASCLLVSLFIPSCSEPESGAASGISPVVEVAINPSLAGRLPTILGEDPEGEEIAAKSLDVLVLVSRPKDLRTSLEGLPREPKERERLGGVVFAIEKNAIPGLMRSMMRKKAKAERPLRICLLESVNALGVSSPSGGEALVLELDKDGAATQLSVLPIDGVTKYLNGVGREQADGQRSR